MLRDKTESALKAFNKYVIQQARQNLTKKDKNTSKKLYNSLKDTLKVSANSFENTIHAAPYWEFVDRGVKGVGGTKADGTPWKKKTVTNSPFAYTNKRPPAKAFDSWVVKRGLAPRSKTGQFQSREGMKIAIANSVYHTGLETTNFITRPFELAFKRLPDDIIESYGMDVETFLKFTLKAN